MPKSAVRQPAAIRQENVEMRMPAQQLAGRLEEADRAGNDILAAEPGPKVEPEGPPGTAGQLTEELAVEAEEGPQPFRQPTTI